MSEIVKALPWVVVDTEGETVAACRYAITAADLALGSTTGTTVRHGRRTVLEITEGMRGDRTGEAARKLANAMIAMVYKRERVA